MANTKVKDPPGPLQTERLPNGNRQLIRKLVVQVGDDTMVAVPEGFLFGRLAYRNARKVREPVEAASAR